MTKFNLKEHIAKNKSTFFGSLNEGQFSWMTQDTGEQIGSQDENQIPVYMFDNKGKFYYENDYDGYGVFGGKDYYELVAEMNGYTADNAEEFGGMFNDLRGIGIKLAFDELETKNENGDVLFPALITRPNFNWKSHDFTQEPKNDPNQSWYEPEKEDEDDDYGSDNDDDYDDSRDVDDDEYGDMAEGKKQYYKDAEADDAEHIKALEKDMKDDKKSGKMKMSELKAKIKEMVLAEMESNNMEDAPQNEVDFLAELEGMLSEAKDEEVADEEVEVTDDFSIEEPQGPGGIDVTQNANADLTGTKKEIQDNLEAALEAARTLGDEKLATQVGNTITFFNKQHVVKDTTVAENLKEILLLQKRAGIITETQYKQKLNEISKNEDEVPLTSKVKSFINKAIADSKKDGEFENLKKADWFENELIDELIELFPNKDYDSASPEVMDYIKDKIK